MTLLCGLSDVVPIGVMGTSALTLTTARLQLVELNAELSDAISAYRLRNLEHFAASSPLRSDRYYSADEWRRRLASSTAMLLSARDAFGFAMQEQGSSRVIGHIEFTQIARGPFQSCYLGYGIDQAFVGRNLMFEALTAAIDFAFSTNIHRIQANHLPNNARSATLLARLGFCIEGHARDYLFINGRWQDHVMTALLNPHPVTPALE